MASRPVAVEWYQSDPTVTASVSIKGLSSDEQSSIRPSFESHRCAIRVGDNIYWETFLAHAIVPEGCTYRAGRLRVEMKMRKVDPVQWGDYEATAPPLTPADCPNLSQKMTLLPTSTPSLPTSSPSLPTSTPSLSPAPSPPEKRSPRKPFFTPVQNDFVYLNHLSHDWMDKGDGEVRVKVMVGGINRDTCSIDFKSRHLELLFQTTDEKFLTSYTGSSQTTFIWKTHLYDVIVPDASRYQVTAHAVIIFLKKATSQKWKSLERSKHQSSLSSNSNETNPVAGKDHSTDRKTSSDSNSNDSEMNDLDAADDYTPTPPSDTPPSHTAHVNGPVPAATIANTTPKTSQTSSGGSGGKHEHASSSKSETNQAGGEPVQNFHTNPLYKLPPTSHSGHTHTAPLRSKTTPVRVAPSELEVSDPNYRYEQLRRPSTTGLVNLGNTCFMNSILQCLSNTPELRDYFVSGRYLANINTENPLGFEGKLAKCFSMILRKLWSGEYDYFSPRKLMEIVAKRSKSFDGQSQHDSHEFMSYLIDGLHEDLNRVRKKPTTKPVEMEDHPDREVAAESWRVHKKRNDSVMVEYFQGQFKSTLVCQDCNKESVTFDPFLSLSVPIPKNLRRLPVIFVPQDPYATPKQFILQLPPEATLRLLKASVARRTSLSMAQLRVFEVYRGKFHSLMADNAQPISRIKANDIIIVSEVLSDRSVKGRDCVVEVNVVQRVQIAPFPTKCGFCGRVAEEGVKLQRCGRCKAVGYCDRSCQEQDWTEHKLKCGKMRGFPVGLPFVISLLLSELTFSKLTEYAEKFASHSVTVTRKHQQISVQGKSSDDSMQESAESIQSFTESIQGSAENSQASEESMEVSTETSKRSIQESADSIQTSNESIQESAVDIQEKPMYTLIRVNRFAENIHGAVSLKDTGQSSLEFDSDTVYLAMDWRNDPAERDSVMVTPKPTMDHIQDKDDALTSSSDTVSLTQCLQLFTEPETLSKDEAWYCPRCKEHRQAIKQMSVWRLPRFLVIHLKRFSFHNFVWRSKIDRLVTFPLRGLDMSPYLLGDAAKDIPPETPPIYDLYATVNHYGNIYIGHYIATVKPPLSHEDNHKEEWLCYDDHKVGVMGEDKVRCNEAYVLFYRRRDASSSSSPH